MNKILIIADLGHFKAYKVSKEPMESARVTLIESYDTIDGHGRMGEKLSDNAGRFSRGDKGTTTVSGGSGEPHNLALETEKRLVKLIAEDISELISRERCTDWNLAAPAKINKQIIENLKPGIKDKMNKSVTANLTKTDKSEILGYFE